MSQIGRIVGLLRSWLGGWSLVLGVIVVIAVGVGVFWEREREVPVPPNATQVTSAIVAEVRQTTFRYPGSVDDVRSFYKSALPERGWRYCGTQATAGCTNMIKLVDRPDDAMDVYRRTDDQNNQGITVEVWPIATENNQIFVTIYETRSK